MTADPDILERPDRIRGAFLGAVALHAAVAGGLILSSWTSHTNSFGALQAGGNTVGVQAVNTIPLIHHGQQNPLANDTESQVPQTPAPVKAKERVKEKPPPPDAIPLKLRKSKQKPAPETTSRQRFRPLNELLPNQLTSQTAPQVSNQAFSAIPGAGRIGAGVHTTLGSEFAGYADQIRQIVASKWRTNDVNAQTAPTVIATFDLMRDGSIRNLQLLQRSGVTALDFSVQRAIQEAAPFPPIPAGFSRSSASVEFWFELQR
ncbi:MAG TPA: TonB family protein [Bryobacteraceae bacterium]|jgi:TonB family protein